MAASADAEAQPREQHPFAQASLSPKLTPSRWINFVDCLPLAPNPPLNSNLVACVPNQSLSF
jgi:hypothetical protein